MLLNILIFRSQPEIRDWLTIHAPWFDDFIAIAYQENMTYSEFAKECLNNLKDMALPAKDTKPRQCSIDGAPVPAAPKEAPKIDRKIFVDNSNLMGNKANTLLHQSFLSLASLIFKIPAFSTLSLDLASLGHYSVAVISPFSIFSSSFLTSVSISSSILQCILLLLPLYSPIKIYEYYGFFRKPSLGKCLLHVLKFETVFSYYDPFLTSRLHLPSFLGSSFSAFAVWLAMPILYFNSMIFSIVCRS